MVEDMDEYDEDDALDLGDLAPAATDPAGAVHEPSVALPDGYVYGVTRYADVILQQALPDRFNDLVEVLDGFTIKVDELRAGGGGRTVFVRRFDESLEAHGWGKRNIEIGKTIDGELISNVRGHEIDMFAVGTDDRPYPGVACEMEWNNKDPFFDRDLLNFQALHREGALAVGIIVTRGEGLNQLLMRTVLHEGKRTSKYGQSSTHWNKLVPRVNLGGGGECPLLLVGIDTPRIDGADELLEAMVWFRQADELREAWRETYDAWSDAEPEWTRLMEAGYAVLGH
jgi:hypothetical protein